MTGLATRTIAIWSAVTVALSLLFAAIPLLLFPEAGANDGAGPMTALFGIPMVTAAVLIQLGALRRGGGPFVLRLLPWMIATVLGMLFLAIPATLADRRYYAAETLGGMLATLAGFAFISLLGAACGIVLWFLAVVPAASLALAIARAWRGETVRPATIAIPAVILAAELVVVGLIVALNVDETRDLVAVQIAGALLGLPGLYEVWSETGLWIVRALVLASLVTGVILTVTRREDDDTD